MTTWSKLVWSSSAICELATNLKLHLGYCMTNAAGKLCPVLRQGVTYRIDRGVVSQSFSGEPACFSHSASLRKRSELMQSFPKSGGAICSPKRVVVNTAKFVGFVSRAVPEVRHSYRGLA